jgi:DNA-binding SARP family transcriptional activator/DNA-binding HxlR family transcriptional regulator
MAAVGQGWNPLILQAALFGETTRFSDFVSRLEIEGETLEARLIELVDVGLMELHHTSKVLANTKFRLTQKGRELGPSVIALSAWGDRWAELERVPLAYRHRDCGGAIEQILKCDRCDEMPELDEVIATTATESPKPIAIPEWPSDLDLDGMEPIHIKIEIFLMGAFALRIGGEMVTSLPVGAQRLLAYLALHDHSVTRISMAGTMWPEVSDQSAGGSLRSALSRLDQPTRNAIKMVSSGLRLAADVIVDLREAQALAHRLIQDAPLADDDDVSPQALAALSMDLLPDWYDEWVLGEAADWRQTRLNALESLCEVFIARARWAEAAEAARAAMKVEPLRESAQATLIRVHMAEGNQSEALRSFEEYRELLMTELNIEPTSRISDLVAGIKKE